MSTTEITSPTSTRSDSRTALRAALLVALPATLVGFLGTWRPAMWTDEVATKDAVARSLPELVAMTRNADAVHGLHYVLVWLWTRAFGESPLALRSLSAVACGLGIAGVVLLAAAVTGRVRAGVCAGVVLSLMPVTLWAAGEARSSGFVIAAAVWTCLALVRAWQDGGKGRWVVYGVAVAASTLLFVQMILLVAAHACTLAWARADRMSWVRWGVAATAATVACLPFVALSFSQRAQVDWIPPLNLHSFVYGTARTIWFGDSWWCAVPVWMLVAYTVLLPRRAGAAWSGRPPLVALAVPWLVLPVCALALVSVTFSPMFVGRYLHWCAGAVALLAGAALDSFESRVVRVALLVVLAVAAVPEYVAQRGVYAKGADLSVAAAQVERHAHACSDVVFVPDTGEPSSPRHVLDAYPGAFAGLDDIGLRATATQRDELWSIGVAPAAVPATLRPSRCALLLAPVVGRDAWTQAQLDALGLDTQLLWHGPTTALYRAHRAGDTG